MLKTSAIDECAGRRTAGTPAPQHAVDAPGNARPVPRGPSATSGADVVVLRGSLAALVRHGTHAAPNSGIRLSSPQIATAGKKKKKIATGIREPGPAPYGTGATESRDPYILGRTLLEWPRLRDSRDRHRTCHWAIATHG